MVIIMGVVCSLPSYAKEGNEHFNDMQSIFPFSTSSKHARVYDLYYTINSYLDEPNWVENNLKRPSCIVNDKVFSTIQFKNHRIWFHWGLSDPQFPSKSLAKKFSPLVSIVNEKLTRYDDRERFWALVCKEEHERLQVLFQKAVLAFGYNPNSLYDIQRDQIWALTTILYSIHLLGDHTTSEYKIIRDEIDLREDIYSSIRTLAGPKNRQKANDLISFLKKTAPISDIGRGTMNCSAQKFLEAMKDKKHGFSQFILSCNGFGYDYKSRFGI